MPELLTTTETPPESQPAGFRMMHTADDVDELVTHLKSPTRCRPVVIVSVARGVVPYPVPPQDIATQLHNDAEVYVLSDSDLAWELDRHRDFRTYGGAVRVVGSNGQGAIIRTDGDRDDALDRIAASTRICAKRMRPARPAAPAPDNAVSELDDERAKRARAEERAAAAARELSAARSEIEQLRRVLAAESAPLFADPETQFRDDVQRSWLRQIPERDRPQCPLRAFQIGPKFLDSVDMPQAPRRKIVEVVVDVLTRRAFEMPSRSVRAHGDGGPAGVNGQVVRADGATGFRCNIRANTPQAPRLMWWELTDGSVELALAGRHDDVMPS